MRKRLLWLASAAALVALVGPPGASARDPWPAEDGRGVREFHERDESTISRTLHFAGSGDRTLDVRAIHGSIRVIGADRTDVQLDVQRVVRAETDDDIEAAERDVVLEIADGTARIEAIVHEKDGDVCGEESRSRSGSWQRPRYVVTHDFAIHVPRDTRLRLCTINGREVVVDGTRGDFDLANVNGRVIMANVSGSGSARTVNGAIEASFSEQPRQSSSFTTINGDLIVGFPADFSADLKMKTFHGGLFTDFDVEALPQPTAVAERRGDRFVYRSNQFTLVRAGRGGPVLTFETLNGSVRVIRAVR
jgi:hypothetical protein